MQKKKIILAIVLILFISFSTYLALENWAQETEKTIVDKDLEVINEEDQQEEINLTVELDEIIEEQLVALNGAIKPDRESSAQEQGLPARSQLTTRVSQETPAIQGEQKNEEPQRVEEPIQSKPQQTNIKQGLNPYVLNIIKTYDFRNISYPYLVNTDYANYNGVTTNIVYQGKILARAHPSGNRASHCVGITFEVFYKAMQERNRQQGKPADSFNGLSWNQMHAFMLNWYVAGPKKNNNVAVAVEKYGFGKRITNFEDARPGDFMDFSRENNTGHTVVFLEWIRDNNRIVGFKYWSSQESTRGIGYREEYFNIWNGNKKYGNVLMDPVYIARVY